MHTLGMIILWTALQVTVVGALVFLVLPFARKSDPQWRTQILLVGIAAVLLISVCGMSPWPNWSQVWESHQTATDENQLSTTNASPPPLQTTPSEVDVAPSTSMESPEMQWKDEEEPSSAWSAAWTEFLAQVKKSRQPIAFQETQEVPSEDKPAFTVGSVIGFLFLLGLGLSLIRLLAGIWLLRREIHRSQAIDEERIHRMIREIVGESSGKFPVEIRISRRLQTAATT
ncbi:MAG: hypothetical protein KDA84_30510, partial [Planctomycetaceae bacterium]|nr:hypothetical protein [Planctomycetaceae bacterium]